MTEAELIDRCLQNNREAQKRLYDTYSGQMYSICFRYCGDRAAATDALQNGFIKIFQHLSSFNGSGQFKAWIKKIIIRSALLEIRKKKSLSFVELDNVNDLTNGSSKVSFEYDRYDYQRIIALVNQLPDGYRTIFSMAVIDEMSHKEISSALDISENTSRSQLLRARRILQKEVLADAYLKNEYSLKNKIHTS